MTRPYAVYRNGLLWTRTLTEGKARRVAAELESKGFKGVSVAYEKEDK